MSGPVSWDSPLPPRPGTAAFVVAGLFFAVPSLGMTSFALFRRATTELRCWPHSSRTG